MAYQSGKILIVEDEDILRKALCVMLGDNGFKVIESGNGLEALKALADHDDISAIALDWMMPEMNGIEFLKTIKQDPKYKDIPVVMQTAATSSDNIREGIANGVYYYLTKPYDEETLLAIIRSAINDRRKYDEARSQVDRVINLLGLMKSAVFDFRTPQESSDIVYMLARACPNPEEVAMGLNELCLNAIEHGNLGLSYKDKTELVMAGKWYEEIERMLQLPENQDKRVTLELKKVGDEYMVTIADEGSGFDWQSYMEFDVSRATDPNGRGIFMANSGCFKRLEYNAAGNQVTCYIAIE